MERTAYISQKHYNQVQEKWKVELMRVTSPTVGVQEDWDSEFVVSSSNPADRTIRMEFVRPSPAGMRKAVRLQWYEREIQRVQCFKEGKPIDYLVHTSMETGVPRQNYRNGSRSHNSIRNTESASSVMSSIMQGSKKLRQPRITANIGLNF